MRRLNFKDMQAEVRQLRETALLEEASRLLRESQYDALNMDTLAEAVGISKKTLYQHFRTRDDLVAQVLIKGIQALSAELAKLAPEMPPLRKVEHIMRVYLHARFFPGSIIGAIGPEIVVRLKNNNSEVQQHMLDFQRQMAEIVEAGKTGGDIRADVGTPILVRSLFCLANVLETPHRVDQAAHDLERGIQDVINVFMFGVAKQPQ